MKLSNHYFESLSKLFTLLAILGLFFRRGIINPQSLYPFEFFILLAVVSLFIFFYRQSKPSERAVAIYKWVALFGLLMLFLYIGALFGYVRYGFTNTILHNLLVQMIIVSISLAGFIMVYYHGYHNALFRKRVIIAFLAPVLLTPLIFSPKIISSLNLLDSGGYFQGFHESRIGFASTALIAFSFCVVSFLYRKKVSHKITSWLMTILLGCLIFWTGIRSAWLGLMLSIVFITIYSGPQVIKTGKKILSVGILGIFMFITLTISFLLLPNAHKTPVLARLFPSAIKNLPNQDHSTKALARQIIKNPHIEIPQQSRGVIWSQAIKLSVHNWFGIGLEYHNVSRGIIVLKNNQYGKPIISYTGAHNNFLAVALSGGIGALLIFIFILYTVTKTIILDQKKDEEWMILTISFISLFTITFFQGILGNTSWFWIIIALILARENTKIENTTQKQLSIRSQV